MAATRGYVVVQDGKVVSYALALQGRLDVEKVDGASQAYRFHRPFLGTVEAEGKDGVFRVSLYFMERRGYHAQKVTRVEPQREEGRLQRRLDERVRPARTRSPGIQGYLERERASQAAQEARRRETQDLVCYLREVTERFVRPAKAAEPSERDRHADLVRLATSVVGGEVEKGDESDVLHRLARMVLDAGLEV